MNRCFAGIDEKYTNVEFASVILQSIPYDDTSTWGKGADKGFTAFLDATEHMELYDIETGTEAYHHGIHIPAAITVNTSPEAMVKASYLAAEKWIDSGKLPTFFGGEHSISIGVIRAFAEAFNDLTVVQLDAHADLRQEYEGTPFNHACALAEAQRYANVLQVGIRSMDVGEKEYVQEDKIWYAETIYDRNDYIDEVLEKCTDNLYITLDLDVFDPGVLPATGTPEPGGMDWYGILAILKRLFKTGNVRGFDIVELAPIPGQTASEFLAAKLYYKMLSYYFAFSKPAITNG